MNEHTEFIEYLNKLQKTYTEMLKTTKAQCLRNSLLGKIEVIHIILIKYHHLISKTKTQ